MEEKNVFEEEPHGTPQFPFEAFSQDDPQGTYFVGYHWHDELEMIAVTSGSFRLCTESKSILLKKGNIYFVNPCTVHAIFGNEPNSHHYALVFPMSFLSFRQYDICQYHYLDPLLSHRLLFPEGDVLEEKCRTQIRLLIEKIAISYDFPSDTAYLSIKIALYQILEILFENQLFLSVSLEEWQKERGEDTILKNVFSYIEQNYGNKITLENLADCAHMNKNYFCEFFKKKIGKTPFSYLNEYRINQAAVQLKKTNASVTEIAFQTGFENMGYFVRQFRRYKTCTPSAFRKINF